MPDWRSDYRKMSKPRQVEGIGDAYLVRPSGFVLVQIFRRLPVTPSFISLLSLLAGWWTAWYYYRASLAGAFSAAAVLGALAFLLHSAFDSADGQLARLTQQQTPLGRLIDGMSDNFVFLGLYVAIMLGYWGRVQQHHLLMFVLALVAGASHSLQCALVEYQRLMYQDFVADKMRMSDTDPIKLEPEIHRLMGRLGPLFNAWHLSYYSQQRALSRSTARVQERGGWLRRNRPRTFARFQSVYARQQGKTLWSWGLMAPNTHKLAMVLAAFLPAWPGSFWSELGMSWFFLFDIAWNVPLLGLIWWQSRTDRETLARIDGASAVEGAGGGIPAPINTPVESS